MRLNSGVRVPSMFDLAPTKDLSIEERLFQNHVLRIGTVKSVLQPSNPLNSNKKFPEYEVITVEQQGKNGTSYSTYNNCLAIQSFGGIGDFFEYTYRAQTKTKNKFLGVDSLNQDGAFVLLLFVNGRGDRPIIIGALPHPNRETEPVENITQLKGAFNGIGWKIDNDGAFSLKFQGATDSEGKPLQDLGETSLQIEKDGSVQLKHKGATLRLDKTGKITLAAQDQISITGQKGADVSVKEDILIKTPKNISLELKDMLMKASGSASLEFKSMRFQASQGLEVKANNFSINSQIANIKGTQINLDGLVFAGGAGGLPALTVTTTILGVGNLGLPVISYPVAGFATKVFVR